MWAVFSVGSVQKRGDKMGLHSATEMGDGRLFQDKGSYSRIFDAVAAAHLQVG